MKSGFIEVPLSGFADQLQILLLQLIFVFDVRGIGENAIDRTHLNALRRVEMSDALGALVRINNVNLSALRNGAVGAFGFAYVAVNAFVGD